MEKSSKKRNPAIQKFYDGRDSIEELAADMGDSGEVIEFLSRRSLISLSNSFYGEENEEAPEDTEVFETPFSSLPYSEELRGIPVAKDGNVKFIYDTTERSFVLIGESKDAFAFRVDFTPGYYHANEMYVPDRFMFLFNYLSENTVKTCVCVFPGFDAWTVNASEYVPSSRSIDAEVYSEDDEMSVIHVPNVSATKIFDRFIIKDPSI